MQLQEGDVYYNTRSKVTRTIRYIEPSQHDPSVNMVCYSDSDTPQYPQVISEASFKLLEDFSFSHRRDITITEPGIGYMMVQTTIPSGQFFFVSARNNVLYISDPVEFAEHVFVAILHGLEEIIIPSLGLACTLEVIEGEYTDLLISTDLDTSQVDSDLIRAHVQHLNNVRNASPTLTVKDGVLTFRGDPIAFIEANKNHATLPLGKKYASYHYLHEQYGDKMADYYTESTINTWWNTIMNTMQER